MQMKNEALLQFLKGEGKLRILLIENDELSLPIDMLLPQAEIQTISAPELIEWSRENEDRSHTVEKDGFDYIILGNILEQTEKPEQLLHFLRECLDRRGSLLASVHNIRHWSVLKDLMDGHWRYSENGVVQRTSRRFFALPELIHLFETAQYKEIDFAPRRMPAPEGLLKCLLQCGFVNEHDDLEVEEWLIKAGKADQRTEMLRSVANPEVRRQLVFLLRRIENDIEPEKNGAELWRLCSKEKIGVAYLAALASNAMLYPDKVLAITALHLYEKNELETAMILLQESCNLLPTSGKLAYVLASLLHLQKKEDLAESVLVKFAGHDDDVDHLLAEMRRARYDR